MNYIRDLREKLGHKAIIDKIKDGEIRL